MKKILIFFFLILPIQPVFGQSDFKSELIVLKLADSFTRQEDVPLCKFVRQIDFVPLESKPEALISDGASFEITKEFIIVRQIGLAGKYQILLFGKGNGKFIREIGKRGRGPGEYSIWSSVPFDPVKKEIYAISASGELIAYDLMGKDIDRIKIPEWIDTKIPKSNNPRTSVDNQRILITADNMLDENVFVGYIMNNSGWEQRKLALFSKDGVLKVYPNFLTYKNVNQTGFPVPPLGGFAKFYKRDNKLNFIEAFCDTLYQVTKEFLIPRYFFDWGKYNAPYSKQIEIRSNGHYWDYFYITNIDENKNYIFLQFIFGQKGYLAYVDKSKNIIKFCKTGISGTSALRDDVSGLMDVVPMGFTDNQEMVYVVQPLKLIKWMKENPEKASEVSNRFNWLNEVNELSNPVIAIGKCND